MESYPEQKSCFILLKHRAQVSLRGREGKINSNSIKMSFKSHTSAGCNKPKEISVCH